MELGERHNLYVRTYPAPLKHLSSFKSYSFVFILNKYKGAGSIRPAKGGAH